VFFLVEPGGVRVGYSQGCENASGVRFWTGDQNLLLAVEVQFSNPYALDCRQGFFGKDNRHIGKGGRLSNEAGARLENNVGYEVVQ